MRSASWSEGISSEKKATFLPARVAAWAATLRAKAVLPTEGRAARTVSVPGWKPRVFLSRDVDAGRHPGDGREPGLDPLLHRLQVFQGAEGRLGDPLQGLDAGALGGAEHLLLRGVEEALDVGPAS